MAAALLTLAFLLVAPPFQILTTHLPPPVQGRPYYVPLQAKGGTPPFQWVILDGRLPPGLALDVNKGIIAGVPANAKPFSITIQVTDSSSPPLAETRLLPSSKTAPLALDWATAPTLSGATLTGAVHAQNAAGADATVTVIVVAVNERGKAFALRYARAPLADGAATPELTFSQALPPGTYTLNADAVAEIAPGVIYRQHLERSGFEISGAGGP